MQEDPQRSLDRDPEPSPQIPLFTAMRAETLLGHSRFCASLFGHLEKELRGLSDPVGDESDTEVARKIVDEHQAAILAVAQQLETGKTLAIDEIRDICELG